MTFTISEKFPLEPVLEVDEIQGNVLAGFQKDHQMVIGLTIHDVLAAKRWLRASAPHISSLREVLAFNRLYRDMRRRHGDELTSLRATWTNLSFSFDGLKKLTTDAQHMQDEAFRIGMAARSGLLGDPTDPADEGHPQNWIVGGPGKVPDLLLLVASDDSSDLDRAVTRWLASAKKGGLVVDYQERGTVRPDMPGHEHFGFRDNVSQPGVRGRASHAEADFITPRYVDSKDPQAPYMGKPGQFLVWPGEFVLGYPSQNSRDPLLAGPVRELQPSWTRNGTFLVCRRLRQDVVRFWKFITDEASRIKADPAFKGMTPDYLAALLVGRWKSGAPLLRSPHHDDPKLGRDDLANNLFNVGADTRAVSLIPPYAGHDHFSQAKGDPLGLVCPVSAHIRKVNPRDQSSEMGAAADTLTRRVIRRGIPFGAPLADPAKHDPLKGNRGLLWLSYQSSIERQFEFLQAAWMNTKDRPRTPPGHDVFIGQNGAVGEGRQRECTIFAGLGASATVRTKEAWVIPTGGGYFFTPAIGVIKDVLSA